MASPPEQGSGINNEQRGVLIGKRVNFDPNWINVAKLIRKYVMT